MFQALYKAFSLIYHGDNVILIILLCLYIIQFTIIIEIIIITCSCHGTTHEVYVFAICDRICEKGSYTRIQFFDFKEV